MRDKEFLIWLHDRLICIHGESHNVDYMMKFRCIIDQMDSDQTTPNVCTKSIEEIKYGEKLGYKSST